MNKRVFGLLLLSFIPLLGGLLRLVGLSTGDTTMDGHARFAADPFPAVLHIVGATSFATLGALQFLPALRRSSWHRIAGRVLAAFGVIASLAGTWMIVRWPHKPLDSHALDALRIAAGLSMAAFIVYSVRQARRGDLDSHARWMTRAYALGAAGGTQAFTLAPLMLGSLRTETMNAVLFSAGWVINLAVAEWVMRPSRRPSIASLEVAS
jgi:uncharacterized membrane protein